MNTDIIREVQRALGLTPDGVAGPKTWSAIRDRLVPTVPPQPLPTSQPNSATVDPRSEGNIASLLPPVRNIARSLVRAAAEHGIQIKVISGLRTYEQQDELYAQGRSRPGPVVTKARGGYSNHNFGIAFDIGVFDAAGQYVPESPLYKAVAVLGKQLRLSWGGDWQSIQDEPHYELRPPWARDISEAQMLAELRRRHDAGEPVFT